MAKQTMKMNLRKINKPHNFINRKRLPREVQQSAGHLPAQRKRRIIILPSESKTAITPSPANAGKLATPKKTMLKRQRQLR
jgi:hypothetical protein